MLLAHLLRAFLRAMVGSVQTELVREHLLPKQHVLDSGNSTRP